MLHHAAKLLLSQILNEKAVLITLLPLTKFWFQNPFIVLKVIEDLERRTKSKSLLRTSKSFCLCGLYLSLFIVLPINEEIYKIQGGIFNVQK